MKNLYHNHVTTVIRRYCQYLPTKSENAPNVLPEIYKVLGSQHIIVHSPWLAAVLLRRGPHHLYLWSDWLKKQCKALMLACLPPLLCLKFCYFLSFALVSFFFCNCDIMNIHTHIHVSSFYFTFTTNYSNVKKWLTLTYRFRVMCVDI